MAAEGSGPWRQTSEHEACQRRLASWVWAQEAGGRPAGGSGCLQSKETHSVIKCHLLEAG